MSVSSSFRQEWPSRVTILEVLPDGTRTPRGECATLEAAEVWRAQQAEPARWEFDSLPPRRVQLHTPAPAG